MNTIVIPHAIGEQMRALLRDAPLESAGVLFCNVVRGNGWTKCLATTFKPYEPEDYITRTESRLSVSPVAVNRHLQMARQDEQCVIQVHTHPSDGHAEFSPIDDRGEAEMLPTVFQRVKSPVHGSLVIGTRTWSARIYTNPVQCGCARILEVGREIARMDRIKDLCVEDHLDRSVRLMGREGQSVLRQLRVGVVGLGGTGSIATQQLAHLGVQNFVLIDHDNVEETNLNRLVGSVPKDVGTAKVTVAKRELLSVNPTAFATAIRGDVVDESTARHLLECDVIFCCTDSQASRGVLNWIAYQYFIPMFDIGVEITVRERLIEAITGRAQLVGPEMPCLHCCEVVNLARLREEIMTDEQRAADQYVSGARVVQPAVISLNGVVVSLATTMLIGAATGLPIVARMQTYNALKGEVRPAVAYRKEGCPLCSDSSRVYGRGESLIPIWRRPEESYSTPSEAADEPSL